FKLQNYCLPIQHFLCIHPTSIIRSYISSDFDVFHDRGQRILFEGTFETSNGNLLPGQPSANVLSITDRAANSNHDSLFPNRLKGFPWYRLLDGSLMQFFNELSSSSEWKSGLANPSFTNQPIKDMFTFMKEILPTHQWTEKHLGESALKMEKWFTVREIAWLKAWFETIEIQPFNTNEGGVQMDFFDLKSFEIDLKYIHTCSRARDKLPKIKDHTGQTATYESFKHYNKKWYDKHNDPLINGKASLPGILEELRIDKLGIYKHRFHKPPHYNPQHPNRHDVLCVLCHLEEDSYEHLLFQCSMSQHCWKNVINGSSSTADLTKDDWDSIDGNYSSEELIDLSQYVHCLMELRHARRMSSKKIDNFSVSQVESEFIQLLSQKQFEYSFRE
ncbi:hypothetical protein WICPIJ_010036, partial [Wickerhamomyces pijperi]